MAALDAFVARCRTERCAVPVGAGVEVDTVVMEGGAVVARFSRDLGDAPIRLGDAEAFRQSVARAVAPVYPGVPVRVETRGDDLAALVPNVERTPAERDLARRFAPPETGPPLTRPDAAPPAEGMSGRHVALWPSHGWTYNAGNDSWGWQRPRLFTSIEDLLTVGFATRELAPMLERAGAVTLLARERDPQTTGLIVDDTAAEFSGRWTAGPAGFALRDQYGDGQNPFALGTTRTAPSRGGSAAWRATLPAPGAYAVHVSYAAGPDLSDAARYTVEHAGGATDVLVNQQIGGGTWVYLGTFEFNAEAGVVLSASASGAVSADAVRFGGGQGIVARGGETSGRPRWTEAARYYEQFAGAPEFVYNVTGEPDEDYTDDYRSRGEWANWLRGAPYGPTGYEQYPGLGIPVDAVVAWHTDAGIRRNGLIGTLAIYNVPGMDSTRTFPNGTSRLANRDLADGVQTEIVDDLRQLYTADWPRRPLWDRAYSEATRPNVPALLLELLSHQNYRDMRHALDPRFQFDAARAVYKGLGRFWAEQRGDLFTPQPLRPVGLAATFEGGGVRLRWQSQPDPLEPGADPTGYLVQTRDGTLGWSAGEAVSGTEVRLPMPPPGRVRSYRVVAVNAGGQSRPSAALAVGMAEGEQGRPVLVVDGFDRVAAPASVDEPGRVGFVEPVGVPEGQGVVAVGPQTNFDPSDEYKSDAQPGWGASRGSLEGTAVLGNTRDHVAAHGQMLLAMGRSFVSASDEAVEAGTVALAEYAAVDLVLGLERRTPWPDPDDARPPAFEALPAAMRDRLAAYLDGGGALVVSGAHWASDANADPAGAVWLRQRLGVSEDGTTDAAALVSDGADVPFATDYGPDRYAIRSPDRLAPGAPGATVVADYNEGGGAAVAFGRTVSLGVPLASILDDRQRAGLYERLLRLALGD